MWIGPHRERYDGVSASEDRRRAERHWVTLQACCWLVDGGPVLKAHVHDISNLGIAMIVPQCLPIRALLEMDLQLVNGNPVRRIMARVVHADEQDSGWWLIGCAFITELEASEVQVFDARALRARGHGQRRWMRFPCNVGTMSCMSNTRPGEKHPASVLNISPGGIGLLLHRPFDQGTILRCDWTASKNQPAQTFEIRVVRVVEQSPGLWFLGGEFTDRLSDELLNLLID
jgi:hypothetical protein